MATRKTVKKLSHPIEVLREVYFLQDAKARLLGIAEGLRIVDVDKARPTFSALRTVLHDSIATEAQRLAAIAGRLNGLLDPEVAAKVAKQRRHEDALLAGRT